jgi:ATP adenylyltransferase
VSEDDLEGMARPEPDEHPSDAGRLDQLQRLWTPWRMAYIRDPDRGKVSGCPFCVLPAEAEGEGEQGDAEALILHRGEHAYAILNAYPYNPGHFMAVPYRHIADYDELTKAEIDEMSALCQRGIRALRATSRPHAFNIGVNMGALAGAGIAEHIHQHVVPRWGGDTNFMPVVGQTRVLPELLEETYLQLKPAFAETE